MEELLRQELQEFYQYLARSGMINGDFETERVVKFYKPKHLNIQLIDLLTVFQDIIENDPRKVDMSDEDKATLIERWIKSIQEDQTKEESGHKCPYCGHRSLLINDHYSHMEFFHNHPTRF